MGNIHANLSFDAFVNATISGYNLSSIPISYSFWFYIPEDNKNSSYPFFSNGFYSAYLSQDFNKPTVYYPNGYIIFGIQGPSGYSCDVSTLVLAQSNTYLKNGWHHLVINLNSSAPIAANVEIYLNAQKLTDTQMLSNGRSPEDITELKIGKIAGGCVAGIYSLPGNDNYNNKYIDQFIIYNKSLSSTEVSTLYAGGLGYDPFDTSPPQQIASFLGVNLPLLSAQTVDYSPYYINEEYIMLNFEYNNASYQLSKPYIDTANTGTFAINFLSNTQVKFYGFNTLVPTLNINVSACNSYGCTDKFSIPFSVGYSSSGLYQIANVDNIVMERNSEKWVKVGNYFSGNYTNRYVIYTNPDTYEEVIITNDYFAATNDCFYVQLVQDNAVFTSLNKTCTIFDLRFVVDDGVNTATTNNFRLSVTMAGAPTSGTGSTAGDKIGGVVNKFTGVFPSHETISFSTRMGYVFAVMLVTILAGVFLVFNTEEGLRGLVTIGVSSLLFMEFVYFTAIKYIPILMIAVFIVALVVLGIGMFSRSTAGGS